MEKHVCLIPHCRVSEREAKQGINIHINKLSVGGREGGNLCHNSQSWATEETCTNTGSSKTNVYERMALSE